MATAQIVSGLIFVATLVVIMSERIHRTAAAGIGAAVMVVAGTELGSYSQAEALACLDCKPPGLLPGIMILVRYFGP